MALQTRNLQHFSDLGSTSESDSSSVYSILPPYSSRTRNNRSTRLGDDEPCKKKVGSRALRRQNNEAYLEFFLSYLTPPGESNEADYPVVETDNEMTGFSSLFKNETSQIERLCGIPSDGFDSFETTDDELDLSSQKSRNKSGRRRGNKRRQRRKPLVIMETIDEDTEDNSIETFESLHNCEELKAAFLCTSTSALSTPSPSVVLHDEVSDFTDPTCLPTPGSLSPKLLDLIHSSVAFYTRAQDGGRSRQRRKNEQHFCIQDLCLINRVESELRWAFGDSPAANQMWTPSTSLLHIHSPSHSRWIRGRPLVLSGFQRMLVHASATYLGLHSCSRTEVHSRVRQLWVDCKGGTFNPPEQPLVKQVYEIMQGLMTSPQKKTVE